MSLEGFFSHGPNWILFGKIEDTNLLRNLQTMVYMCKLNLQTYI